MYHAIAYKDFKGRTHVRSWKNDRASAMGKARSQPDYASLIACHQVTEAEHVAIQAKLSTRKREMYNQSSAKA